MYTRRPSLLCLELQGKFIAAMFMRVMLWLLLWLGFVVVVVFVAGIAKIRVFPKLAFRCIRGFFRLRWAHSHALAPRHT